MPESHYRPRGKWIVSAIDHPIAPINDNATPLRWRSFSPGMWALYKGFVYSLMQKILWQSWDESTWEMLSEYMLSEQPPETECPECPEPEPPPAPPPAPEQPRPGTVTTGSLGLSIEELEGLLMSSIMGIRFYNGKLQVQYFPCCDWVDVPGLTGTINTSDALEAGLQSIEDWINAGSPPTNPGDGVVHENPFYETFESLKCAKATAIVNTVWDTLEGLGDAVEQGGLGSLGFLAFVQVVATKLGPLGYTVSAGSALAQTLFALATGVSMENFADAMHDVYENTNAKNDLICDLVERMDTPKRYGALTISLVTDSDILTFLERFEEIVPHDPVALQTIKKFPVSGWRDVARSRIATTECGCEDYLPYGYTPPGVPASGFQFKEIVYYGTPATLATGAIQPGIPFEKLALSPDHGQMIGAGEFKSFYIGLSGSGNVNTNTGLALLYEFSEPITLDSVKFDVEIVGAIGSNPVLWRAVSTFTAAEGWLTHNDGVPSASGGGNLTLQSYEDMNLTMVRADVTHMAILLRTQSTNSALYAVVRDVRITGNIGGAPFVDKTPGSDLP